MPQRSSSTLNPQPLNQSWWLNCKWKIDAHRFQLFAETNDAYWDLHSEFVPFIPQSKTPFDSQCSNNGMSGHNSGVPNFPEAVYSRLPSLNWWYNWFAETLPALTHPSMVWYCPGHQIVQKSHIVCWSTSSRLWEQDSFKEAVACLYLHLLVYKC